MSIFDRIIKILASLQLAVIIILAIAVISAVGTIYEAIYMEAEIAQRLVYHSVYMYVTLIMLCITLIAVMVDRWPWKQHHAGFVCAHIGIIILLIGAWLTKEYGIDGSMAFNIGEQRQHVTVKDRDLLVYASFDGQGMKNIYQSPVDFLTDPPTADDPFIVQLGQDQLKFVQYHHFAYRDSEILASDLKRDGPAVRFQLENANVNLTEWLRRDSQRETNELDLGPARVVIASKEQVPSGRNEIILVAEAGGPQITYYIYNKDLSLRKKGTMVQGDTLETGWMGLKFRLLRHLPHSKEVINFTKADYFTPVTTSAAKFIFRDEEYWIGVNSVLRLYVEDRVYVVSYGYRQIQLNFPLRLVDFRVGNYEGTQRAASYESDVEVPGKGRVTVSMNEPLHHEGFTFYQASFEKDQSGKPTASILSVNHDPGRWVKYLGCFLIVLGSILLFWFKRVEWFKSQGSKKGKA